MSSIIEVTSTREFVDGRDPETATRLYISSRKGKASKFAKWVRGHWGIESAPQAHKEVQFEHKLCA